MQAAFVPDVGAVDAEGAEAGGREREVERCIDTEQGHERTLSPRETEAGRRSTDSEFRHGVELLLDGIAKLRGET
jgi:hypothetical protein